MNRVFSRFCMNVWKNKSRLKTCLQHCVLLVGDGYIVFLNFRFNCFTRVFAYYVRHKSKFEELYSMRLFCEENDITHNPLSC